MRKGEEKISSVDAKKKLECPVDNSCTIHILRNQILFADTGARKRRFQAEDLFET